MSTGTIGRCSTEDRLIGYRFHDRPVRPPQTSGSFSLTVMTGGRSGAGRRSARTVAQQPALALVCYGVRAGHIRALAAAKAAA